MPRHTDPRRRCLRFAEWPLQDQIAWLAAVTATGPRFSVGRRVTRLSARSIHKYLHGYGRWLGSLFRRGKLDPAAMPADRATHENLEAYFAELLELGNADYTIAGRFDELRNALNLLAPGRDNSHVIRPNGQSLRTWLPMEKRNLAIHHPADLYLWGLELMQRALSLNGNSRRRVMMRDGLLICILAFRGLRLRSALSLTLGENVRRDPEAGDWRLEVEADDVKNAKYISATLPKILAPWIDRYVGIERHELLAGHDRNAFWINWGGEKLEEKGLDKRIRWLSEKRFGPVGVFGTHRFRHCIATATPLILPEHPGLAAALLQITHGVLNEHYDRSGAVLAFRSFHETIDRERCESASVAEVAFREQDTHVSQHGSGT